MNFTLSTTGEEGLTLLRQVKIFRPETPVILMTAWGSIQLAVQGMQAGAFDFITKPWNNAALLQRIETALELAGSPKETTQEQNDAFDRRHIIGRSQGLTEVLNTIARIAKTNASVLITGESGTGKELIAEAIHINSQRAKQPFVKVNLGGISQSFPNTAEAIPATPKANPKNNPEISPSLLGNNSCAYNSMAGKADERIRPTQKLIIIVASKPT